MCFSCCYALYAMSCSLDFQVTWQGLNLCLLCLSQKMVRCHGKPDAPSARACVSKAIASINKAFTVDPEPFVKPRKVLVLGSGGEYP